MNLTDWIQSHGHELVSFLTQRLKCRDTAQDLAQETFLRICESSREAAIENPGAFAFRVARNLAVDHQRKRATRARHEAANAPPDEMEGVPDRSIEPGNVLRHRERLAKLNEALAELPTDCRTAFYMNRSEGCSHAEIARRLGISETMVSRHLLRAMRHCRLRLEDL